MLFTEKFSILKFELVCQKFDHIKPSKINLNTESPGLKENKVVGSLVPAGGIKMPCMTKEKLTTPHSDWMRKY